jgi:hypothetical protein
MLDVCAKMAHIVVIETRNERIRIMLSSIIRGALFIARWEHAETEHFESVGDARNAAIHATRRDEALAEAIGFASR